MERKWILKVDQRRHSHLDQEPAGSQEKRLCGPHVGLWHISFLFSIFLKKNVKTGAPGWLSWLSVQLQLRSWSRSSWVRALLWALCWQLGGWSLLRILCLPLSLPLPHLCSVSLCLSKISKCKNFKKLTKFRILCEHNLYIEVIKSNRNKMFNFWIRKSAYTSNQPSGHSWCFQIIRILKSLIKMI